MPVAARFVAARLDLGCRSIVVEVMSQKALGARARAPYLRAAGRGGHAWCLRSV